MKTPAGIIAETFSLLSKYQTIAFQKTYKYTDGFQVKIEPVPEMDSFDNEASICSHVVYYAAPGQVKFEDVKSEHLQGHAYVIEQEIMECQLLMWERLKPRR